MVNDNKPTVVSALAGLIVTVLGAGMLNAEPAPATQAAGAPPKPWPAGMVWIPSGTFQMGSETIRDAQPVHAVKISGFFMDQRSVTNAEFAKFVAATHYVTVAERKPDPKDFPGVPLEALVPGSLVFTPPAQPVPLNDVTAWWAYVPGACWNHPQGPRSDIKGQDDLPVVQVSYEDASAYAKWAGKRLPTEAEFEYAARGGLDRKEFVWGDEQRPGGKHMANTWQGHFPDQNNAEDGFPGLAPGGSFPANGFGLYDMSGNCWQWCSDLYRADYYAHSPAADPTGPQTSLDPDEPNAVKHVQRGGSFLCNDSYCGAYRPAVRGKGEVSSAASHIGFRCVVSR